MKITLTLSEQRRKLQHILLEPVSSWAREFITAVAAHLAAMYVWHRVFGMGH